MCNFIHPDTIAGMKSFAAALMVAVSASWCVADGQAPAAVGAYLGSEGHRLYYESCGSGPALVLLHDGLLHSVVWDDVWPSLCAKYHVVRYDRRGYGRSDAATEPFSPEDDLLTILDATAVRTATLVGSSSGTAVATDFTLVHPERVQALVLVGPVVHGMRSSDAFLERGAANNAPLSSGNIEATATNWAQDPYQVFGPRPDARKKIRDALISSPHNLTTGGAQEIRPTPPSVTRLSTIEAPTLLIVGEHDIADVHAFTGALQAALPVVRREVWRDAGHLVALEQPDSLVKRIDAFIAVTQRKMVVVSQEALRRYEGRYRVGCVTGIIAVKERRLVLQLNGDADVPLFPATSSMFFVRTTGTDVAFEQEGSAAATAMIITNPGGAPVRCPRI